jgi:hypothetical protein
MMLLPQAPRPVVDIHFMLAVQIEDDVTSAAHAKSEAVLMTRKQLAIQLPNIAVGRSVGEEGLAEIKREALKRSPARNSAHVKSLHGQSNRLIHHLLGSPPFVLTLALCATRTANATCAPGDWYHAWPLAPHLLGLTAQLGRAQNRRSASARHLVSSP